jgi:HSP20 family protein
MATQERKQGEQSTTKNQEPKKQEVMPAAQHRGALAQRGSLEPLRQFRDEFDRMFDRFLGSWSGGRPFGWPSREAGQASDYWGFDFDETDKDVVVRAEAPGFEPGDFDLQVRGNQLVLSGHHREETTEKDQPARAWSEREICRSVTLPAEVDAEKVDAQYRNGVLTITLPKSTPTSSRRINVKG